MSWNDPLDNYCERTSSAFWAEPLNVLTNFSFFFAFIYCYSLLRKTAGKTGATVLLTWIVWTMLFTAVGSFLFHTVATKLTMWGDILPILLFLLSSIYYFLFHLMSWSKLKTILLLLIFLIVSVVLCLPPFNQYLNGSLLYAPTVLVLLYFSYYFPKMKWVLSVFILSLIARTLDQIVCDSFPLGLHFIWHLLNGLVMVLTFRVMVDRREQECL